MEKKCSRIPVDPETEVIAQSDDLYRAGRQGGRVADDEGRRWSGKRCGLNSGVMKKKVLEPAATVSSWITGRVESQPRELRDA